MSSIAEWNWQERVNLKIDQYKLSRQKNREDDDLGDKKEQSLRDLRDSMTGVDIHVIRVQKGRERGCELIMDENFPTLDKDVSFIDLRSSANQNRINPKKSMLTNNQTAEN